MAWENNNCGWVLHWWALVIITTSHCHSYTLQAQDAIDCFFVIVMVIIIFCCVGKSKRVKPRTQHCWDQNPTLQSNNRTTIPSFQSTSQLLPSDQRLRSRQFSSGISYNHNQYINIIMLVPSGQNWQRNKWFKIILLIQYCIHIISLSLVLVWLVTCDIFIFHCHCLQKME